MNNNDKTVGASRSKLSILTMAVLSVVAFCIYKTILVDRMGFCYSRIWFVSSEELILGTIDGLMKSGLMKLTEDETNSRIYLSHHPNCCGVNWGATGEFTRGILFYGSATVTVTYELSEKGRKYYGVVDGSPENYYQYIADDTACGETVGYIGIVSRAPASR